MEHSHFQKLSVKLASQLENISEVNSSEALFTAAAYVRVGVLALAMVTRDMNYVNKLIIHAVEEAHNKLMEK